MSIFGEISVVHGCTPSLKSHIFTISSHMHHSQNVRHITGIVERILLLVLQFAFREHKHTHTQTLAAFFFISV